MIVVRWLLERVLIMQAKESFVIPRKACDLWREDELDARFLQ